MARDAVTCKVINIKSISYLFGLVIVKFLSDHFFYLGLIRIVEATLKYRKCS